MKQAAEKLGNLVEQSPKGFIFFAGLWQLVDRDINWVKNKKLFYSFKGLAKPNSKIPIVFIEDNNGIEYLHVYCPNSTNKWQIRKRKEDGHPPNLCPNVWLEGHLNVPDLSHIMDDFKSGRIKGNFPVVEFLWQKLYARVLGTKLRKHDVPWKYSTVSSKS